MFSLGGGYERNKLDVVEPELVGMLQGISQTIGNLSGVVVVPVTSLLATRLGWNALFYVIASELIITAGVYFVFTYTNKITVGSPRLVQEESSVNPNDTE